MQVLSEETSNQKDQVKGNDWIGDIVQQHIDEEPNTNPDVVEKIREKEEPEPQSNDQQSFRFSEESATERFNPSIHATDNNGNPVRKKDGTYAKKRGPKGKQPFKAEPQREAVAGEAVPLPDIGKAEATATVVVVGLTGTLEALLGNKWKASNDERVFMRDALRDYMLVSNLEAPPEFALIIAFGSYALPRLLAKEPNGSERSSNNGSTGNRDSVPGDFSGGVSGNKP